MPPLNHDESRSPFERVYNPSRDHSSTEVGSDRLVCSEANEVSRDNVSSEISTNSIAAYEENHGDYVREDEGTSGVHFITQVSYFFSFARCIF